MAVVCIISGLIGAVAGGMCTFVYTTRQTFKDGLKEALAASALLQMENADRELAEKRDGNDAVSEHDKIRRERLATNSAFFKHCAKDGVIRKRVDELGFSYNWPAKTNFAAVANHRQKRAD